MQKRTVYTIRGDMLSGRLERIGMSDLIDGDLRIVLTERPVNGVIIIKGFTINNGGQSEEDKSNT